MDDSSKRQAVVLLVMGERRGKQNKLGKQGGLIPVAATWSM
jgi:hypothetical protein